MCRSPIGEKKQQLSPSSINNITNRSLDLGFQNGTFYSLLNFLKQSTNITNDDIYLLREYVKSPIIYSLQVARSYF